MEWLSAEGIPVLPLEQAWQTPGSVALTFDDGATNFLEHAVPVLDRLQLPATMFVVSGRCGQRNGWDSTTRGIPVLALMSWNELRGLPPSIQIGSHTVSHPNLASLPAPDAERELRDSRVEIEDRLGRPVTTLAYPYGAVNEAVTAMAARHYRVACSTKLRFVPTDALPERLPRLDMYYLRDEFWFRRFHRPSGRLYLRLRALAREARP